MPTPCFLLEATDMVQVYLRRYASRCSADASPYSYHNAMFSLGQQPRTPEMTLLRDNHGPVALDDPRWPTHCEACAHEFKSDDAKQYFHRDLYRRVDNGQLITLRDAPVGAMYYVDQFNDYYANMRGPDGRTLVVKTPGGEWCIDARASNCDSPCKHCGVPYKDHPQAGCGAYLDKNPEHRCWVRHGQAPHVHVDKNGNTCGAGAGSFVDASQRWHGFLHNGVLTP